MQEDLEQKTVTLIIKTGKLTGRTLGKACSKLLHYSTNKIKHHKEVKPKGKQSVKKLIAQNQGVETAELANKEEMKKFDRLAKRYGVDYAIRKGFSEQGEPRFMLFFKGRDRQAIDQVLASYMREWSQQRREEKPSLRQELMELKRGMPGKQKEKHKEPIR